MISWTDKEARALIRWALRKERYPLAELSTEPPDDGRGGYAVTITDTQGRSHSTYISPRELEKRLTTFRVWLRGILTPAGETDTTRSTTPILVTSAVPPARE